MHKLLYLVFLMLLCPTIQAQQVHKCRDANGHTTYSDAPCNGSEKTLFDATPPRRSTDLTNSPATSRQTTKTLVIYGRDTCGNTRATKKKLTAAGIPFQYKLIDDPDVSEPLHRRMHARGIRTASYTLPIVEIDGDFEFNPDRNALIARFKTP